MDRNRQKKIGAVLAFLCLEFMVIDTASAHRVNVFAWVEGDTAYVESKFAGGRPVKAGQVVVIDSQGNVLLSGVTDDAGGFSFKIPERTDLKIVLSAGEGHRGEWTIRAAEMMDLPPLAVSDAGAENSRIAEPKPVVSKISADTGTATPDNDMKVQELEAFIESVLDRKLKPITRMLADMQQKGPGVKDILGGLGYIFGLAGIAAYIQSRKKKP